MIKVKKSVFKEMIHQLELAQNDQFVNITEQLINEAKKQVKNNVALHNVRRSCFHDVWQKWCESETTQEFDKWIHDKLHEA